MAKKTNYDSDFCGSLPLNHINVIQDYGYLLVVDNRDFKILQVSENVNQLLQAELPAITGALLSDFIETSPLKKLRDRFESRSKDKIPLTLTIGNARLQALAHFKDAYTILEIEKAGLASERAFTQVYEEVKYAMAALELCETIEEVSAAAVTELKKLTGFDGIMMYRFDSDWNGTVIAQDKTAPELEDYMGHTFPASDIPKQARALYLKNPYRLIPKRNYQPVRLYPVINPVSNTFIDLSDCNLRGVAAVHLEYLKNMKVEASMSIRVIHNGQLWGLVACHHVAPHYLNFELCSICELLSTVVSNKISAILNKTNFDLETELQKQQSALIAQVYAENNLLAIKSITGNNSFLNMFSAGGLAIIYQGKLETLGEIPDKDMVENMVLWLQSKTTDKIFATDQLPELFEEAAPYAAIASGALAIPISADHGEYLIYFRPEVIQTIKWGGDPNQAIRFDLDGKKYHPRASFQIWQETVHHTSAPWSLLEIAAAERLRSFIYEFTSKQKEL